jgi:hypothetical protein
MCLHRPAGCTGQRALSGFIQFMSGGKLVFPEQVADLHILFHSFE